MFSAIINSNVFNDGLVIMLEVTKGKRGIRLTKGAKETFGWVVVGENRKLVIPPTAWVRYGFSVGEHVIFITGSKKSGGFGLTNARLMEGISIPLGRDHFLGRNILYEERMTYIPDEVLVESGDWLLTVFGSRYSLGFITRGPIYHEAIKYPGLDEFRREQS